MTSDMGRAVLTSSQRKICRDNLALMTAVAMAAQHTADICQQEFADRRWNCSSVGLAPFFTSDLTGGISYHIFVTLLLQSHIRNVGLEEKKYIHNYICWKESNKAVDQLLVGLLLYYFLSKSLRRLHLVYVYSCQLGIDLHQIKVTHTLCKRLLIKWNKQNE